MNRQEFREKLQAAIQRQLLEGIKQHIESRFSFFDQLLRYVSALERKHEAGESTEQGFLSIFKNIENTIADEGAQSFSETYVAAVDEIAEAFPALEVWRQNESRFTLQKSDPFFTKAAKIGKQIVRVVSRSFFSLGQRIKSLFGGDVRPYPKWKQEIPLRNVTVHFLMDEEFVSGISHELQRMQLEIITDLEDLVVASHDKDGALEVEDFISSKSDKLEQQKFKLQQQVSNFVENKKSAIEKKVETAGTIEQRGSTFSDPQLQETRRHLLEGQQSNVEQWRKIQQLFLKRTQDVIQFLKLWVHLSSRIKKFRETYKGLFVEHLDKPLSELQRMLEQAVGQVHEEEVINIDGLRDRLDSFLRTEIIEPMNQLLEKRILSEKTEHFFEDLLLSAGQSSERALLIFDVDLEKNPPTANQKEIEWRQLVVRALREQFINVLQPSEQENEAFLSQSLEDVEEIQNIIQVNLESVLEVKEEDLEQSEDPREVAREALERILAKVGTLQERTSEKWDTIEQHLEEGEERFSSSLLSLLHEGNIKELQLLKAKYRVKETTNGWRTLLDSRWAAMEERLMIWARFAGKKSSKYLFKGKHLLGIEHQKVEKAKRADIASYLSETDQKMKELPYIYRQLFNFDTSADERFNVRSDESIQTFKKAYEQWQKQIPSLFAVVGEKGSGKSSFLDLMLDQQLQNQEIAHIEFEDTIWTEAQLINKITSELDLKQANTVDDLITEINQFESPRAVVLESLQNCFVRNINGFEAIEKLCYLITETRLNVFWMISCSRYAWTFLEKVLQISEHFSHVAKSDGLNAEQIEKVILNRHRASGYSLYFEPDDSMLKSRTFRKLKDQEGKAQEHLQEKYFEKLSELAEGNASVAIIFWIRSIRDYDDTCFYIEPLEVKKVEMLDNLSTDVLFTLAAFVLHDTLLDDYLAMVLNTSREESRLMINRLRSRGLLEKKGDLYTINHLVYRQIVRTLKERNIIHLV
ncbi:MAG: hypothetical protein ACQEST_00880 [Bacteroidota bacterium]